MADSISPSALKRIRRDEREAWAAYAAKRRGAHDAARVLVGPLPIDFSLGRMAPIPGESGAD